MKYRSESSYSKSKFSLLKKNDKIFIKKKPAKIDAREFESINKQNQFKKFKIRNFTVEAAKIELKKEDIIKSKFYLVEFFQGKNGEEILSNGDVNEIKILKLFFKNYIKQANKNTKVILRNKKSIIKKYNQISKHRNFKKIKNFKSIKNYLFLLLKKNIYTFDNYNCHGDLTLSNIILNSKDKKIILIDFQKTYEDNLMQDLSKLFQEFNLGWTSRNFSKINKLRSEIVCKSILKNDFWRMFNKNMLHSFKVEFIMTILRIIPYVDKNDKITLDWIYESFILIKTFKIK